MYSNHALQGGTVHATHVDGDKETAYVSSAAKSTGYSKPFSTLGIQCWQFGGEKYDSISDITMREGRVAL